MSNEKKEEDSKNLKNEGAANNVVANGPQIKFTKSDPSICIDEPDNVEQDKNFPGLTKEQLMEFVDDPYWVRIRWIIFITFWIIWFAMLITAIVLIVLAPKCPVKPEVKWWEHSVVYQIYPKTFQDSDGDGIGDLPGLTSRLDYLKKLDVKGIGLSALFPSSGHDYDVIDHMELDSALGTMDNFKEMAKKFHKKEMNLILDFIPTITSIHHTWFNQSQLGGNANNYSDYYIWQQGAGGGNSNPPNEWKTKDGASTWKFNSKRGEFYLFHENENQPMLNLGSPFVQEELLEIAKFWLDNGVDGFRVINLEQPLENSGDQKSWTAPLQPEIYSFLADLREIMDSRYENRDDYRISPFNKPARVLIVDASGSANQTAPLVTQDDLPGAHMVTNPTLLTIDQGCGTACIAKTVTEYINDLPKGFKANWKLTDEHQQRAASRTAEGSTRVTSMLLMTLPGTAFVLYGDEIAMRDAISLNDKNLTELDPLTPMQWSNEYNAGFSTNVRPWKPVNPTYIIRNVKAGTAHGAGTTDLEVFMSLSKLRNEPSFIWGRFEKVDLPTPDIFAYVRQAEGFKGYLVAMNFPSEGTSITNSYADFHQALPHLIPAEAEIVATTANFPDTRWTEYEVGLKVSMEQFVLHPGEGVIFSFPWKHNIFSL